MLRQIRRIERKGMISNREAVFITRSKKQISVSVSVLRQEDEKNEFIGYFLSAIDVSESKKFEQRLKREVERKIRGLQDRVEELEEFHRLTVGREMKMIELKKINEELEQKVGQLEREIEKQKTKNF